MRRPEELHHAVPRGLLSLHEEANGNTALDGQGIQAWLDWEMEAMRCRVPVEISRDDLKRRLEGPKMVSNERKVG